MKRNIFFCCLFATLFPLTSMADVWQDPEYKVNYEYTPGSGVAFVKSIDYWYTGDVIIRSSFSAGEEEYIVDSIADYAFNGRKLTSCNIPSSVTGIGNGAFKSCSALTSVNIPESISSIGDGTFRGCSALTNITIPESVKTIGEDVFRFCSKLVEITLPSALTSIGNSVFLGCSSLPSITIPSNVTSIGDYAFYDCSSLNNVIIPKNVASIGENAFMNSGLTSVEFEDCSVEIGTYAFANCGNLSKIKFPDHLQSIGIRAFNGCTQLKSLKIPNCTISEYCFSGCGNLESVTFYGTGRPYVIKLWAFYGDKNLKAVTFSEGLSEIGREAFYGCAKLESILFPKSLKIIGDKAFYGCYDIQSIKFQEGLETIGSDAFRRCGCSSMGNKDKVLKEVTFPKGLKYIGAAAFNSCDNLKKVSFPESLEYIGSHAFTSCSLNAVNIPAKVNFIGNAAFVANYPAIEQIHVDKDNIKYDSRQDCSCIIETATGILMAGSQNSFIPEGIREIGESAFCYCDKLTSAKFTIPEGVTTIGSGAFWECRELVDVEIPSSVTYIGEDAFYGTGWYNEQKNGFLYLNGWLLGYIGDKSDVTGTYSIKDGTKGIAGRVFSGCSGLTNVVLPHGIKTIGEWAFAGCIALTTISIPNTVTSIGDFAFNDCNSLSSITIPNGVLRVGYGTFSNCSGLTSVTIPNSVTSIGERAFMSCSALTTLSIPNGVKTIEGEAFWGCESLASVTIPSTTSSIGADAFAYCVGLTSLLFSDGLITIGNYAFRLCTGLTSIIIPNTVTSIGSGAFAGCSNLENVNIPPEVKVINESVFSGCENITNITIPEDVTSIGTSAFWGCSAITTLTIPQTVASIGSRAFMDCKSLTDITSNIRQPFPINRDVFYNDLGNSYVFTSATLHVPAGTSGYYMETDGWNQFKEIVELDGMSLTIDVFNHDGLNVTDGVSIVWYNADGIQIGTGEKINGVLDNSEIYYSVILDENLGRIYREVSMQKVIVGDKDETITCKLEKIGRVMLEGRVSATDIDKNTMTVGVRQMLNGKWEETFQTQTNEQGVFKVEVYDDKTEITISGEGYFDASLHREGFNGNGNVGTIPVNLLSGFVIAANITMQKAVAEGETEGITAWTDELNNIDFTLTNTTRGSTITDFTVQNGNIIIKAGADVGDEINLTAKSKQGIFADATTSFIIEDGANSFDLQLTELGGFDATYVASNNGTTIGYIYNNDGILVAKGCYKGEALSLRHQLKGVYTLVSMGNSSLLGNMKRLADLTATGLREGTDYVTTLIEVVDGKLASVDVEEVPQLDETPFYYTNKNTYFSVNKPSVTAGNYVTLSAHIDFKPDYADKVDILTLYIDLPEGCEMVENSIIVNRESVAAYILNDNRLTMLLSKEEYESQVRFCIIPTLNQNYTVTAMASFDVDGQVQQPVGSAQFEAKGLSLSVPGLTAKTNVTINGTAKGHSKVNIYDNEVLIGKTSSKADGSWTAECELFKPYSHSFHAIYAKITTEDGMELTSETRQIVYDKNNIVPEKVTMTYYNGWYNKNKTVEFNLLEGTTTPSSYSFYSGTYFTFLADFSRNDTTQIKNVNIKVLNSDGTVRTLPASFDGKRNCWVATTKYESSSRLPQNVAVEYDLLPDDLDEDHSDAIAEMATIMVNSSSLIQQKLEQDVSLSLKEENENSLFFDYSLNENLYSYDIEEVNYNEAEKLMNENQFIYIQVDSTVIGRYTEWNDNSIMVIAVDVTNRYAFRILLSNTQNSASVRRLAPADIINGLGTFAGYLGDFVGVSKYWTVRNDFNNLMSLIENYQNTYNKVRTKVTQMMLAKCADGNYRLGKTRMQLFEIDKQDISRMEDIFTSKYYQFLSEYKRKLLASIVTDFATMGVMSKINGIVSSSKLIAINSPLNKWFLNYLSAGTSTRTSSQLLSNIIGTTVGQVVSSATDGIDRIFNYQDFQGTHDNVLNWAATENKIILSKYIELEKSIERSYNACKKENKEKEEEKRDEPIDEKSDDKPEFNTKGSTPIIDPSGYVYEAVTSNRLEGVTVTCYQKINGEDMYGEPTEEAVVWNAEDFSQKNPLQTDATGFYQWDVPQGLWQVKYEKEGYETTYSDWLPVPPPQLDVNVGMKQSTPPTVKQMRGYESGITIDLSKYMRPETMTIENITVTRNGSKETGGIELINAEKAPLGEETFVSKVKFVPEKRFNTSDNVVVTVHKEVESYCSVQMTADHVEVVKIEPEVKSIEVDSILTVYYQGEKELRVQVLPKEASAGKTLRVKTSSGMIASVSATEVIINKDGIATLTLGGELPGGAVLDFSVDGTDVSATSKVKVIIREMVEAPIASIISGEVFIGTKIELSCETEDVTIYYTLDGSCPCENSPSRKVYDGTPIVINENTIIKAMAVTSDGSESEVAEFIYTTIDDEDAIINAPSTTTNGKDEYDTSGRKAGNKAKGVIIRKNDGTSRKVLVK